MASELKKGMYIYIIKWYQSNKEQPNQIQLIPTEPERDETFIWKVVSFNSSKVNSKQKYVTNHVNYWVDYTVVDRISSTPACLGLWLWNMLMKVRKALRTIWVFENRYHLGFVTHWLFLDFYHWPWSLNPLRKLKTQHF